MHRVDLDSGDVGVPEGTVIDPGNSDSSREGEFSGTNNQESGVDEADFLRQTDTTCTC